MQLVSHEIVRAIVQEVIFSFESNTENLSGKKFEGICEYVYGQINQLSTYLLVGLSVVLLLFRVFSFCFTLKSFERLSMASRSDVISKWQRIPVPPLRDMVDLFRSLTLVYYFKDLEGASGDPNY